MHSSAVAVTLADVALFRLRTHNAAVATRGSYSSCRGRAASRKVAGSWLYEAN
jgi:hypothetical protein